MSSDVLKESGLPSWFLSFFGRTLKRCTPLIAKELSTIVFRRADALVVIGGIIQVLPLLPVSVVLISNLELVRFGTIPLIT